MSADADRRRVADALKTKRRPPPPPPDPEDSDPLLDAAGASDAPGDDLATWKMDPVTRRRAHEFRQKYIAATRQLIAYALQSTDPKVAALAGQVQTLSAVLQSMGGKA